MMRLPIHLIAVIASCAVPLAKVVPIKECQVSVELSAATFKVSHQVRPKLVSKGLDVIWLSGARPRGFRVERQVDAVWQPPPGASEEVVSPAVEFRIDDPDLLPIVWRDVASEATPDGFVVPPGRYRLVLTFAAADPGTHPDTPPDCVVRSAPFGVETAESYTTWE